MNAGGTVTGAIPKVSVLILNYNGADDTCACVRSLREDGFADKEIIVWDNGSRGDDAGRIQSACPEVRFFRSDSNLGFAAGNNRACVEAKGEFVVLLNSDTLVQKGWIEPMLAEFRSDPAIVACQPKLRSMIDPTVFDYAGAAGGFLDGLGFSYTRGRVVATVETDHGQYDQALDIDWATGACLMARRSDYLGAGGFDELFFAYSEEIDLCMRWTRKGRRIRCVPSSVILHRSGTTWKKRPHLFLYYKHRNSILTLMNNVSWLQLIWVLPARLALEVVAAAYYCVKSGPSQGAAPLRSVIMSLLLFPAMARKRGSDPAYRLRGGCVLWQYFVLKRRTFVAIRNIE